MFCCNVHKEATSIFFRILPNSCIEVPQDSKKLDLLEEALAHIEVDWSYFERQLDSWTLKGIFQQLRDPLQRKL